MEQNKKGRVLFIVEAALEYFISIVIGGAYLAKITTAIGMSQGLTGICTSLVSLGAAFQIFALFMARKSNPKRLITLLHTINQLCFAIVYLIPLISIPTIFKHTMFVVFLLSGHIISNLIGAPKIGWYMTFVGEEQRGRFTANKEMVSLVSGMAFSYLVSFVIDYFEKSGRLSIAFVVSGAAIFVLMLSHTLTLIKTPAKQMPVMQGKASFFDALKTVFSASRTRKVMVVASLWNVISCSCIAFFGAYQVNSVAEHGLGFSMLYVAVVAIVGALVRTVFSRPIGKLSDKYSFKSTAVLCYSVLAAGLAVCIFTVPANGKIMFMVYTVLHAVALAGINSSIINLLYEEVAPEQRMCAYAVQQSVSGIIGFLAALGAGVFVDAVARRGGRLAGMYAQQWLSVWGLALTVFVILFVLFAMKAKKPDIGQTDK